MGEKWLIDKSHPFDSVARIDVKKRRPWSKGEKTLIIHETFMIYLKDSVLDVKEIKEVLHSLSEQQSERYDMKTNKNNPFYGDEAGFEHYCRLKYKKLYDHIERMIDQLYKHKN
jgi:hypothetical protein